MTRHIVGLDAYKIVLFIIIFMFHCKIHIGCNYGGLSDFISVGAVVMSGFFMYSGFILSKTQHGSISDGLLGFYIKRLLAILPLYYVVTFIYPIFIEQQNLKDFFTLLPIEIFGIQSAFCSLFKTSHNAGTWFVSCILMCYFCFPLINELLKKQKNYTLIMIGSAIYFLLVYSPYIVLVYNLNDIYSNPFFRILEFTLGIIIYHISYINRKVIEFSNLMSIVLLILLMIILVVTVGIYGKVHYNRDYMSYSIITLPILSCALLVSSCIDISEKHSLLRRVIVSLGKMAYAFWLAQFFTFPLMNIYVIPNVDDGNCFLIISSFLLNTLVTLVLHYMIDCPIKRRFMPYILRRCYNDA